MKWRVALINATIPAASFYTIQFEDHSVMDYNSDLQSELLSMRYHDEMIGSTTGDEFGQWQEKFEMPDFLKEQLCKRGF
jgi:hypothetical protein